MDSGEPYIDENGALVEVAPGLKVDAPDGRTLDGDDVANAAWYRANKWLGETLRDASVGVPYSKEVLGQSNAALAITAVVAEVQTRTPGVAGVVSVQVDKYDAVTRTLVWSGIMIREDGDEHATVLSVI